MGSHASDQEKSVNAQQIQFMNQLQSQYQTQFGENQAVLKTLTDSLTPIVNAGINQEGFSPAEKAALNTQAAQGAANANKQSMQAADQEMMARGGGNSFIPSAARDAIDAGIGVSTENVLGNEKLGIVQQDYAQGRANYGAALSALSGAPGQLENPLAGQATEVNNASQNAFSSSDTIHKEYQSPFSAVMGVVGSLAGAAVGDPALGGQLSGAFGGAGNGQAAASPSMGGGFPGAGYLGGLFGSGAPSASDFNSTPSSPLPGNAVDWNS